MAHTLKAAMLTLLIIASGAASAVAQNPLLEDMYGQGVHEFNKHNYAKSIELFSAAIDEGYQEPTAHYFRGFAYHSIGNPTQAAEDFAAGSRLEAQLGTDPRAIGLALQRVQGTARINLETERRRAKISIRAEERSREKARYGDFLDNQNRVLRNPGATPAAPTPPAKTGGGTAPVDPTPGDPFGGGATPVDPAPAPGDPFGGGTAPVDPAPVDPAPADPFGGAEKPDPGADPFGGPAPVDPAPADPFGGPVPVDPAPVDPAPADPFGGPAPVDPAPVDPAPADPFGGPAPVDPAPVDPAPADPFGGPAPVDPAPVDPAPADPFGGPVPVDPAPVDPAPADPFGGPAPIDPAPVDPAPADPFGGPAPIDPAPVDPAPADPFGAPDKAMPADGADAKASGGGLFGSLMKAVVGGLPGDAEEAAPNPFDEGEDVVVDPFE